MKGEWTSIDSIAEGVRSGETTAAELAERSISRLEELDPGADGLNAFISHDAAGLRSSAAALDQRVEAGDKDGPLVGVPVAVKDNICTLDLPTTCGSNFLEGFHSPYEATIVRRLREAGALIVGKTNLDEFAMGSTTENSAFGPTRNPVDPARTAGGSSGGSAAAVAAGIVPIAIGSDTGGSVRQPAAYCGIVGLKPSYGRISRYGLVSLASSLDTVGIMGRGVADTAQLLEILAGPDRFDATAAELPVPNFDDALDGGLEGLVIGLPSEFFPDELDPGVRAACEGAIEQIREAGAEVREVSLPHTRYAVSAYYLIVSAEASSDLARLDGVHYGHRAPRANSTGAVYEESRGEGFGPEVKRRILLGTRILSSDNYDRFYGPALRTRELITRELRDLFAGGVDLIFTPTTLTPAPLLGEEAESLYHQYIGDRLTVTANLAALPAISVPVGTAGGLPVGGQFMADRWDEVTLIRAAAALERLIG